MIRLLLSAFCALVVLSQFIAQAQTTSSPASTGSTAATPAPGSSAGNGGLGGHRHGLGGPERHARGIIAKFDKDGDHALNATELAAFFESVRERLTEHGTQPASNTSTTTTTSAGQKTPHGNPQEHAARAIEKFDKNGDGKLDVHELAALLTALRERGMERQEQGQNQSQTSTQSQTSGQSQSTPATALPSPPPN